MENIKIIKETSPHLRRKDTLFGMMLDVIIALLPIIIFSLIVYQLKALRNILISVATMELCEFIYVVLIKGHLPYDGTKHSFKEHFQNGLKSYSKTNIIVPLVSALIYALIMPSDTNPGYMIYIALVAGAIFGLVIGKLVFGGTGKNIFNPAAVGMVFSKLCFGSYYTYPMSTIWYDTSAGATALSTDFVSISSKTFDLTQYSLIDMLIGKMPGLMGEVCKVAIFLGLIYLIVRHTIDWRIPLGYVATVATIMLSVGIVVHIGNANINPFHFMCYELLSGGLFFGATYMATDPVTSPTCRPGRFIYACLLGSVTCIIRLFGALPEGVAFSILIGNFLTPVIDYDRWSSNKYSWKNILAIALSVLLPLIICVIATSLEVL